jgi:hypothetical protein
MVRTPDRPPLTVIGPTATIISPPRALGEHGRALWNAVHSAYHVDDVAGCELLAQACVMADRAERLREAIDQDGEMVHTRAGGVRAHPALKDELAARAFICKTLERLGLNLETLRPSPGRPPRSSGWRGGHAD